MPTLHPHKLMELSGHGGPVYALTAGRTAGRVLSGSADRNVAEWDLENLEASPFSVQLEGTAFSIDHIPERSLLCIGRSNGSLHLIDLDQKKEIKHWKAHRNGIFDLQYSFHTGHLYSLGGDGILSLWSLEDLSLFRQIPLSEKKLRMMALDTSHNRIAIATGDARIRILDTELYNELHTLEAHHPGANIVRFHPNGKHLLTAGRDAHLSVWELSGNPLMMKTLPAHYYSIYALEFSPDEKYFATASRDKTIKIWDTETFEFLAKIDRPNTGGHRGSVNALHWDESTGYLVSSGDDGKIMIWKMS